VRGLENVHAHASRRGYAGWDFESRLHLGELELRSGNSGSARAHLLQLEMDARQKGFLLIVREAAAALNNSARRQTTPGAVGALGGKDR